MTIADKLAGLAQRAPALIEHLETEEATKNALVMPFIAALGYDVFNPSEVVPEFHADIGTKKGEKVDYAILREGTPSILIECKKINVSLGNAETNQLYRYFTATQARIGVVTNGVQYDFYTDLDAPNKMDSRPFLSVDLLDLRDTTVAELNALSRDAFNIDLILKNAGRLKYLVGIKDVLAAQLNEPDEEFTRFFFTRVAPGEQFRAATREHFSGIVRSAFHGFLNDRVTGRLRSALQHENAQPDAVDASDEESQIETTVDELLGYHIVKSILRDTVKPERIVHRDTRSYMGVLLDDTNRKPICRLHFNRKQRYLGLFNPEKQETRVRLDDLNDIFTHADHLRQTVSNYEALDDAKSRAGITDNQQSHG